MPGGRKSKFTPDRQKKILDGIRNGMTKRAASACGGISEDTLLGWLAQPSKASFSAQIAEAENIAESRYTDVIAKAAFGHDVVTEKTVTKPDGSVIRTVERKKEYDWHAALEWLKRRKRQEYGDRIDLNLNDEIERTMRALQRVTQPEDAPDESATTIH